MPTTSVLPLGAQSNVRVSKSGFLERLCPELNERGKLTSCEQVIEVVVVGLEVPVVYGMEAGHVVLHLLPWELTSGGEVLLRARVFVHGPVPFVMPQVLPGMLLGKVLEWVGLGGWGGLA